MNSDKYDLKLIVKVLSFVNRYTNNQLPVFSKNIENRFGIKKSYVSSILTELEHDALIFRKSEGKSKKIFITSQGISVIRNCVWQLLNERQLETLDITD